jgi:hypothetical protein
MKIANPWPNYPMCRCICKPGDQVVVQATRKDLEVPDGTTEALIEPVKVVGRGNKVEVVAQGRVWSEAWGLLDIEDHLKKQEIEAEAARMKERAEKERARKAQEARERAKPKEAPKPESKPKEEPKPESKKEQK